MAQKVTAYRCVPCNMNWPINTADTSCPRCGRPTEKEYDMAPDMSLAPSNKIRRAHMEFREFCNQVGPAWEKQQREVAELEAMLDA